MSDSSKSVASHIVDLGGVFVGAIKEKLLRELDASEDTKAEALIMSALYLLLKKIDMPQARKKRLLRLLRDAVTRVHSGM